MSGLIAFTGPPDRQLAERMLRRLSHRGMVKRPIVETHQGTLAVCEWPDVSPLGVAQTGYYSTTSATWAVSGFTFTAVPDSPSNENLNALRGSYSLACLQSGTLTVARDAVGNQSLYYGRVGNRWCIATEPKAITAEAQFRKCIRPAAIAQYLTFSFVPGQGTMLESLFEVEAGTAITFEDGHEPWRSRYFVFEAAEGEHAASTCTSEASDQSWIDQTRQRLEQAVAERLTDGAQAVFLSGGLDSSLVAAEVARQSPRRIRTYSIHFGPKYPNELDYARAVAERIGSQHEEVLIQPKHFLPRLRKMIWHLDEPIGDPITQPNYELAEHVSKDFRYVFNGEGGDPLFGGPKNIPMMLLHWYGDPARPANFREQAYLASYRRAYEEWSRLLHPELRRQIEPQRDLESLLQPFFQTDAPRSFLNKLMAINIRLKGAHLILPKVDRMLAAHRLTPLSPLFDDCLTQLSFEMPPRLKLRSGIEKYVLKRAYADALPPHVISRPKSGMRVPVHYWFRKELRRYAASILSKRNVRNAGIFDEERVQQLLRYETEEGPGRYGLRLWMLLTFEIWRRIVVEGEPI